MQSALLDKGEVQSKSIPYGLCDLGQIPHSCGSPVSKCTEGELNGAFKVLPDLK